ncbi:hypothetical protein C0Q44_15630 [Paenibacillus sp. PCH8]|uniref:hypothetical protein n=1 Tax=Paenibacillus sp. PCH8 TaxID=2066524 RepID=UPI000CF8538C|nr:hypothetical protein [Paenibacillus sp. PCH8]PQP82814.1 hypothetical protein C0Q44_15630 [Paenibacillus sp. PCH8]
MELELNLNNQVQPMIVNRIKGLLNLPELDNELSRSILDKFDFYKLCCLVETAWEASIKMMADSTPELGREKSQRLVSYLESDEALEHLLNTMMGHFEKFIVECYMRTNQLTVSYLNN